MNIRTHLVKIAAVVTLSGAVLGIGSSAAIAADSDPTQGGRAAAVGDQPEQGENNEDQAELLTRKVNEYEGQHR